METGMDTDERDGGKQRYRNEGWRQTEIQKRGMEADRDIEERDGGRQRYRREGWRQTEI